MKIGIVTNYTNINYGSVLQSYALQTKLRGWGESCENIRYSYGNVLKKRNFIFRTLGSLRRFIKDKNLFLRTQKFKTFRENYIAESTELYLTIKHLESTNLIYDTFICGSDQIWGPHQFNEWYYLTFVNNDHLKIAYAPSIGLSNIPEKLQKRIKHFVSRINFISIREKQGAKILMDLLGTNIPVVLDPTLLITAKEWGEVAKHIKIKKTYAFCYFLGNNLEHLELVRKYCNEFGLQMVAPFENIKWGGYDKILSGIGPQEFLGLIMEADIIFTDSFHGTIFAINFNKEFYSFLRFSEESEKNQNSRVVDCLDMFDLSNHLVDDCSNNKFDWRAKIDYKLVNLKLKSYREKSISFLKGAMNA